jgi:hypothetical protein
VTNRGLRIARTQAVLAVALTGAVACGDGRASSGSPLALQPTRHPLTTVARLRGTVDVASGTMTFDPVSSSGTAPSANGVSASLYGDQGITVRIYNSAVITSAPAAGKKTYSANVGIRNLLAFRIGDEQNTPAPVDTMGIYVFTNTAPVVTGTSSPCTCTVTVRNASGALPFTAATAQPYWYWPEIVGAAGGGSDTTRVRRSWVFEADTQVTRFSFDVLVSAAWTAPNDTTWRVEYPADSLPETQAEPRWRKLAGLTATTTIVGGHLSMSNTGASDSIFYYRADSLTTGMNAYIEGRVRLDNGGLRGKPQAGLVLDDGVKMMGVFISDSSKAANRADIGFIKSSGSAAFIGSAGTIDTLVVKSTRAIQLRKYRSDSVVVWVDGTRRLSVLYASMPASRGSAYFMFGSRSPGGSGNASTWESVVYQSGQPAP